MAGRARLTVVLLAVTFVIICATSEDRHCHGARGPRVRGASVPAVTHALWGDGRLGQQS